jgi:hypothetical protein
LFTSVQALPFASCRSQPMLREARAPSRPGRAELPDDRGHDRDLLHVLLPLALKLAAHLALGLGVDEVDAHLVRLAEALQAVHACIQSLNLKPMPRKIAHEQCRWKLQPLPSIEGLPASSAILPSLKSMIERSRSSRSWLP